LHLTAIIEQKEAGHKQYEAQRTIAAKYPGLKREEWASAGASKEDMENYDRLEVEMKKIYDAGWKKFISWSDFLDPRVPDKLKTVKDKLATIQPKG
jgi:hypothetical protein